MDFALYASDTGQLLLGRCGVETWSHDMPVRIPDKEGRTNMLCPLLNTRSHNMASGPSSAQAAGSLHVVGCQQLRL
jgi:hypothetical protein